MPTVLCTKVQSSGWYAQIRNCCLHAQYDITHDQHRNLSMFLSHTISPGMVVWISGRKFIPHLV